MARSALCMLLGRAFESHAVGEKKPTAIKEEKEIKKRHGGDGPGVWALVSTIWQGVRRGCIIREGERGRSPSEHIDTV